MNPELEQALSESREVLITTYDSAGKPGTVPIWFLFEAGRVYMATGRASRKALKLAGNPRVRLSLRPGGPSVMGIGRVCADGDLVGKIAPLLNRKYGGAWGADEGMVQRLLGKDIVLLEVAPANFGE